MGNDIITENEKIRIRTDATLSLLSVFPIKLKYNLGN